MIKFRKAKLLHAKETVGLVLWKVIQVHINICQDIGIAFRRACDTKISRIASSGCSLPAYSALNWHLVLSWGNLWTTLSHNAVVQETAPNQQSVFNLIRSNLLPKMRVKITLNFTNKCLFNIAIDI